jgi:hypothetical protein
MPASAFTAADSAEGTTSRGRHHQWVEEEAAKWEGHLISQGQAPPSRAWTSDDIKPASAFTAFTAASEDVSKKHNEDDANEDANKARQDKKAIADGCQTNSNNYC